MMRKTALLLALSAAVVLASFAWVLAERGGSSAPGVESADANAPAGPGQPASKKPANSLEFWLGRGEAVKADSSATQPTVAEPRGAAENPFRRLDALPGVLQDSKGRILPGGLYTTRNKPWMVWVDGDKVWRRIPFITVLSITAVVIDEKTELKWRWKGMGVPERVYTGQSYPSRELRWQFHLIDGSYITGSVKGQPVIVELHGKRTGPFVFHERQKGPVGQKLEDLVHIRKVIVSRRLMDKLLAGRKKQATRPSKAD